MLCMRMKEIALSVDAMPLYGQETCVYTVALQGKGSEIQSLLD